MISLDLSSLAHASGISEDKDVTISCRRTSGPYCQSLLTARTVDSSPWGGMSAGLHIFTRAVTLTFDGYQDLVYWILNKCFQPLPVPFDPIKAYL